MTRNKKGKRVFLNNQLTQVMMKQLNEFFEFVIEVPRIQLGKHQTIETLIHEEALSIGQYMRNERQSWTPGIV